MNDKYIKTLNILNIIGLIVLIFFSAFWLYKNVDFEPLIVVLGYFISLIINSVTILFNTKQQKPILLAHEQYATHLKNIVTADGESKPLYFFVGKADFIVPWISRICREQVNPPKISELIIVRMTSETINRLIRKGELSKEFLAALNNNIDTMMNDRVLKEKNIRVSIRYWGTLGIPPLHGFKFGNELLYNKWAKDGSGKYHVQTSLIRITPTMASTDYQIKIDEIFYNTMQEKDFG